MKARVLAAALVAGLLLTGCSRQLHVAGDDSARHAQVWLDGRRIGSLEARAGTGSAAGQGDGEMVVFFEGALPSGRHVIDIVSADGDTARHRFRGWFVPVRITVDFGAGQIETR